MSTTTEGSGLVRAAAFALGGWAALLIVITAIAEPSRDVLLLGDPARTLPLLAGSDTRIVTVTARFAIVRGTERGFVRALYANGAWIVLPARGKSCVDLSERTT